MWKKSMLNISYSLVLAAVMLFGSFAGIVYSEDSLDFLEKIQIQQLIAAYVRASYVDSININKLWDGAIQGMIDEP